MSCQSTAAWHDLTNGPKSCHWSSWDLESEMWGLEFETRNSAICWSVSETAAALLEPDQQILDTFRASSGKGKNRDSWTWSAASVTCEVQCNGSVCMKSEQGLIRGFNVESRSVEALIDRKLPLIYKQLLMCGLWHCEGELCVTVTPSGEDTKLRPNTIIKSLPYRLIGLQRDNRKSCSNLVGCLSNWAAHLRGFVKFSFTVAPLALHRTQQMLIRK